MADAAYNDFVSAATIEPLVLVEVEAKQEFVGWETVYHPSRRPDFVQSYQVIVPPFVAEDKTPGGLLAYITSVTLDGVALTQKNSPWEVESTPNSFFWNVFGVAELVEAVLGEAILGQAILGVGDSSFDTNALILHVTDEFGNWDTPDNFDAVAVGRTMYFGTKAVVYNDRLYEPRVDSSTEISLKEATDDIMFGASKAVGSGSLKLLNGDGLFDKIFSTFIWNNANVTIRFGGPGLTFGQLQTIGTYKVENDPVYDYNAIELNIRDEQKLAEQKIPPNLFDIVDYPSMHDSFAGSPIPLLIGLKTGIKPVTVVDTAAGDTTSAHTYMISDPAFGGIYSLDSVYLVDTEGKVTDTITLPSAYVQISLTGGTFSILGTFSGEQAVTNANVRVNAKGIPVTGADYETSTDYLKYYGELVGWIYMELLGLQEEKFDSTSAIAVDDEFSYDQGIWIDDVQQAKVLIRKLETGVLGRTIRTLEGIMKPTVFTPETDFSAVTSLIDVDVMEFQPSNEIESGKIFSRVRVLYDADPVTDKTEFKESYEARTQYLYLDGIDETRILETALRTATHALDLAQRVRFISRVPTLRVTIPETGLSLMDANLVDRIQVTVARGPDVTGAWNSKLMEIDTIERTFAPVPKVVVTMNDLLGVSGSGARWVGAGHANWAASDDDERASAGYWSNTDGFIVPDDVSTRDIKLWF